MDIILNYNGKETSVKIPENYMELITQFKTIYSINEILLQKMNVYYIDEDNEKIIISNDEDLSVFIDSAKENQIVKCIYCELLDKKDEKNYDKDDEINRLQIEMEALKLKNKEEIEQKEDEYKNKINQELESKENTIKIKLLEKENLLNQEIKNKENEFKENIQKPILIKIKEIEAQN